MKVFVGYDGREDEAYRVCKHSIEKYGHTVIPMKHKQLRDIGLFDRPWRTGETGQMVDERDGKPFSTEFSHTRFLVPEYARHLKLHEPWVLFCDCDFLFLDDPVHILDHADSTKAIVVVQHDHAPAVGMKMDGVLQTAYPRKNWSSLILWNLDSSANDITADDVNHRTGQELHRFYWLHDDQIGRLPEAWNFLVGHSEGQPQAVHFTDGGPWFEKYRDVPYAKRWLREKREMLLAEFEAA